MPTKIPTWAWWALAGAAAFLMTGDTKIPDRLALLRGLHPEAQQRFLALVLAIEKLGYRVELTSGKRPGLSDYHGLGLAIDFNIVAPGRFGRRYGSTALGKGNEKADWEATGVPALIRRMGFRWGGDFVTQWKDLHGNWHTAYDPIHADLGSVYSRTKLLALATELARKQGVSLDKFNILTMPLAA